MSVFFAYAIDHEALLYVLDNAVDLMPKHW